ncbi:MAG: prolipoprotein diacylglyceryl transferase [Clostridia bacterium]|nr:prolipoprotein diacylglyceryl transferase [Clostridia bacterium]
MTVLLRLGSFQVTPYGLLILAGALCGVLLCLPKRKVLPVLPWVILGALLLGHAFWVFLCSPAYTEAFGTVGLMVQLWRGGYTLYGALLGGALGALIGSRLNRLRFPEVLDALAPGACAAIFFGRLGEYFSRQGFGNTVENESLCFFPLAYCTYSDGDYQEWSYAVWFWEAVAALVLLLLLVSLFRKSPEGRRTVVFVSFLGLTQILLEQMRRDDFVRLNPFVRFSQIAAALTLLALLIVLCLRRRPSLRQTLLTFAAFIAAVLAVMMAEFVFDKPQMTWMLYTALAATALLLWAQLAAFRGSGASMPAGFFCLAAVLLLLLHALGSWEQDSLLLYAMMALALSAIGAEVAVLLPRDSTVGR